MVAIGAPIAAENRVAVAGHLEDLVIEELRGLEKNLWMLQAQVADPAVNAA